MSTAAVTFSIVIPTHDYARFLPLALDSVLQQERDDVEVIIVDDASTDDTPAVVARYLAEHPGIVRSHRLDENLGASGAWETGLELATGTYVCKLDADDWQLPGFLDAVEAAFATDERIGLVATSVWLHREGSGEVLLETKAAVDETLDEAALRHLLLRKFFVRMPGTAIRRATLVGHGPPRRDLRLPHDWEYFLRALDGWKARILAEPLAVYRIHASSLTVTSGQHERLRGDMELFLSLVRDPVDPAHLASAADRRRFARGVGESYLGSIGPRLRATDVVGIARHTAWAVRLAGSESLRSGVLVALYLLNGGWQRLVAWRSRPTRPVADVLPPSHRV